MRTNRRSWPALPVLAGVTLLAGASVSACAFRTPPVNVPASLAPIVSEDLDVTVILVGERGEPVADHPAMRRHAVELFRRAASERGLGVAASPADARAEVRVAIAPHPSISLQRFYLPLLMWMLPFGFVTTHDRVTVEIALSAGDRVYRGRGTADVWGSIYSPPERRALAVALDRALADAAPIDP